MPVKLSGEYWNMISVSVDLGRQLADVARAFHRDVRDAGTVEAEHHPPLQVVEVEL